VSRRRVSPPNKTTRCRALSYATAASPRGLGAVGGLTASHVPATDPGIGLATVGPDPGLGLATVGPDPGLGLATVGRSAGPQATRRGSNGINMRTQRPIPPSQDEFPRQRVPDANM